MSRRSGKLVRGKGRRSLAKLAAHFSGANVAEVAPGQFGGRVRPRPAAGNPIGAQKRYRSRVGVPVGSAAPSRVLAPFPRPENPAGARIRPQLVATLAGGRGRALEEWARA